jgi:hypothetical protein
MDERKREKEKKRRRKKYISKTMGINQTQPCPIFQYFLYSCPNPTVSSTAHSSLALRAS